MSNAPAARRRSRRGSRSCWPPLPDTDSRSCANGAASPSNRVGVAQGRVSQIEQGKLSGQEVIARFAAALGGRLHQAIYFDDGDITAIA
jgi:hypothetical protein